MEISSATAVPVVSLAWKDPRLSEDPAAVLKPIRGLGPVVYNEAEDQWMAMSYDACTEVVGDTSRFDSSSLEEIFTSIFGGFTMEAIDDRHRHREVRGVWAREFRYRTLDEKHREAIDAILDSALDPIAERLEAGEVVDIIDGGVRSIPTLVVAHLLGLDPAIHAQFSLWSDQQIALMAGSFDDSPGGLRRLQEGQQATIEMNAHVAEEIKKRQACPAHDLIDQMVRSEVGLDQHDKIANVTQLVVGGNETTARLMGLTFQVLAEHPEQRQMLLEDRSMIPAAVEELLRYESVVQWFTRTAVEETELAGVNLPAGATVACMLGSANRDESRWADADRFDVTRPPQAQLGFGSGMHVCLGIHLARLEMDLFLNKVLDRMPAWSLAEAVDYGISFPVRGPKHVMVAA